MTILIRKRIIQSITLVLLLCLLTTCSRNSDYLWLSLNDENRGESESYLLRKNFELEHAYKNVFLNISAHQRYRLFINGKYLGTGPQISDPDHPKYDSYELENYLKLGENTIAVEVINFGEYAGQNMFPGGSWLWADCPEIRKFSEDNTWRMKKNTTWFPLQVRGTDKVRGGFLAPGTDSVILEAGLEKWYETDFDDSDWDKLPTVRREDELPLKRNIPFMEKKKERFSRILSGKGAGRNFSFTDSVFSFRVEPHNEVSLLIDNGYLTTGFPEMIFSGGKNASIRISYAESLYYPGQRDADGNLISEGQSKGNRKETKGKNFIGYYDFIRPVGSRSSIFRPTWFRTYRYILLEIETNDSPLIIDDFYGVFTAYPFIREAEFQCNDSVLNKIWNTSWRTARLCAWDTYMDCPYYEQLQYVGDTRIQTLVSLYNTRDYRLMKNAIEQFSWSVDSTGLTLAAYPSKGENRIPPFSLFWTLMIKDYYMHTGDRKFVGPYLEKVKGVYDWHLQYLDDELGVLKGLDYWNFVDWPDEWAWDPEIHTGGMPAGVANGGVSSVLNLQYVYALNEFERVFRDLKKEKWADEYSSIASGITRKIKELCWDASGNILADSPERREFSQHANLLAVLSGMIPTDTVASFIERISMDSSLIQTTIYYRFYLFEALANAGRTDLYYDLLDPWRDMLDLGLTTFAERQEPTRSDCHAWSASPNYHFLSLVCGIRPTEPGFQNLIIKPTPGSLKWIKASMPVPGGNLSFQYSGSDKAVFEIYLPDGIKAKFEYRNISEELKTGSNIIEYENTMSEFKR